MTNEEFLMGQQEAAAAVNRGIADFVLQELPNSSWHFKVRPNIMIKAMLLALDPEAQPETVLKDEFDEENVISVSKTLNRLEQSVLARLAETNVPDAANLLPESSLRILGAISLASSDARQMAEERIERLTKERVEHEQRMAAMSPEERQRWWDKHWESFNKSNRQNPPI